MSNPARQKCSRLYSIRGTLSILLDAIILVPHVCLAIAHSSKFLPADQLLLILQLDASKSVGKNGWEQEVLLANKLIDEILGANAGHRVVMYYFAESVFSFKNGKVKNSAASFASSAVEVVKRTAVQFLFLLYLV